MALNLTERFKRTDSTIEKDYMRCARYAFWKYGANWQSVIPSHHLTFGMAIHKGMEVMNVKGFAHENVQDAFDAFCGVYDAVVPSDLDMQMAPKDRAGARLILEKFANKYSDRRFKTAYLDGKPLIEVYGNLIYKAEVAGQEHELMFVYKIDAIKTDGSKVYVFDYKTKSRQEKYMDMLYDLDSQMNNYNLVLHSMFPPDIVGGCIVNVLLFRKGTLDKKTGVIERGIEVEEIHTSVTPNMLPSRAARLVEWKKAMLEDAIQADAEEAAGAPLTAFKQNTLNCFMWGQECEYRSLCLHRPNEKIWEKMNLIPSNLEVRKWEAGGRANDE